VAQESITKVPKQELTKQAKNVFLSSFFFRWVSSLLQEPLTVVYAQNSSILQWAVHCPIAFS